MSVPAMRPLSLGEALDASLAFYRLLFFQLLGVSLAAQAVPLALSAYVDASSGGTATGGGMFVHPILFLVSLLVAVLAGAIGTAASTMIVSEGYLGRSLTTGGALLRAMKFLGRLLSLSLGVGLLVGLGTLLLIVPGIVIFSGLILSSPALVLENLPSAGAAMRRSWMLTRGFRGKLFGAYFVAFLILAIPPIAITALATTFGLASALVTVQGTGVRIIAAALQILIYPFIYVMTTVLYYDMRVRKEGFDLEMLTALLAPA